MKTSEKSALINAIIDHLDTRDKRFMFLKCMFPASCAYINLEGSARETSTNIFIWFDRSGMLGSLTACMNKVFELELTLTTDAP